MVAPASPLCTTLKRRADFLRAARALRHGAPGLLLQARLRRPDEPAEAPIRIGYTCSKKLGNAVVRNRAKRRLRAVAHALLPAEGRSGWDYVLIGRPAATVDRPFAELRADLRTALARVHRTADRAAARPEPAAPPDPAPPSKDAQAPDAAPAHTAPAHAAPAHVGPARPAPTGGAR